ncbi:MAG: methylated-DNA--[protein]-cysteine S-methyltransferase [candidate division KSB1 bacterium]|nr:methylated-DNA--[protein]-cysteine S-methyltransferase [candidate division KSB1 bacterium]MDZ7346198.1 methylated-DNA--[protein]-cysteine S-methyltransferase [candidate division KSB1 bacterium]
MNKIYTAVYLWQKRALYLAATSQGICVVSFNKVEFESYLRAKGWIKQRSNPLIDRLVACLDNYFAGKRESFDLPLDCEGTAFQTAVWQAVRQIPYGTVQSYGEVAVRSGKPTALRAVGAANGANPTPIIVPCHRVVCSDLRLGGYRGGVELKRTLLELEGMVLDPSGERILKNGASRLFSGRLDLADVDGYKTGRPASH